MTTPVKGSALHHLSTKVELVVKAPNGDVEDVHVPCELGWAVREVKEYLRQHYVGNPSVRNQKLIHAGRLLEDEQTLRDVLWQFEEGLPQILHVVVKSLSSEQVQKRAKSLPHKAMMENLKEKMKLNALKALSEEKHNSTVQPLAGTSSKGAECSTSSPSFPPPPPPSSSSSSDQQQNNPGKEETNAPVTIMKRSESTSSAREISATSTSEHSEVQGRPSTSMSQQKDSPQGERSVSSHANDDAIHVQSGAAETPNAATPEFVNYFHQAVGATAAANPPIFYLTYQFNGDMYAIPTAMISTGQLLAGAGGHPFTGMASGQQNVIPGLNGLFGAGVGGVTMGGAAPGVGVGHTGPPIVNANGDNINNNANNDNVPAAAPDLVEDNMVGGGFGQELNEDANPQGTSKLWVLLKLSFLVYLLGQHLSWERFAGLCLTAVAIFLYECGFMNWMWAENEDQARNNANAAAQPRVFQQGNNVNQGAPGNGNGDQAPINNDSQTTAPEGEGGSSSGTGDENSGQKMAERNEKIKSGEGPSSSTKNGTTNESEVGAGRLHEEVTEQQQQTEEVEANVNGGSTQADVQEDASAAQAAAPRRGILAEIQIFVVGFLESLIPGREMRYGIRGLEAPGAN
eukprot:Nk52_evm38s240 gene=Nk52_evmTU38s240